MKDLKDDYLHLNKKYKKIYTYKWVASGFFSVYNNMLLAMLWCLTHKCQFRIYSKDYKFFEGEGYTHIFQPLPETQSFFEKYLNTRGLYYNDDAPFKTRALVKSALIYKLFSGRLLGSDSFYETRTYWFRKLHFSIPELGIDGDIQDALRKLVDITYRFNDEYEKKISNAISSLNLPEKFIGIHVRGGDKELERDLLSVDKYMSKANEVSEVKNAFILTDNYLFYEDLVKKYPDWNFYTLTFPYERGFVLEDAQKQTKEQRERELLKLIASLKVMSKGEAFIGTVSTNPGMFMGMIMDKDRVFYLDSQEWIIL